MGIKVLMVIPTYNEKENIAEFVKSVLAQTPDVNILVVDDSSPDGTADVVRALQKELPQVHLLLRPGKQGLGRAYIDGFRWGLDQGYDVISQMDADFSHRAEDFKTMLGEIHSADFLIGSLWVAGGKTVNWGVGRKIMSLGGSRYARFLLGFPLADWTGGMNMWKRQVLEGIDLPTVESNGYSFQIELKYRALKRGFKVKEIPIVFEDRRVGQSKMSSKILFEALYRVWRFRFQG